MPEPEPEAESEGPPEGLSKKELKAWTKEKEKQEKQRKKLLAQEEKQRKAGRKKTKEDGHPEPAPEGDLEGEPEPEPEPEPGLQQLKVGAIDSNTHEPAWVTISKGELPPAAAAAPVFDDDLPAEATETTENTRQAGSLPIEPDVSQEEAATYAQQTPISPPMVVEPEPQLELRRAKRLPAAKPPVVRPIASQTVRVRYPRPSSSVLADDGWVMEACTGSNRWSAWTPRVYRESDATDITLSDWCTAEGRESTHAALSPAQPAEKGTASPRLVRKDISQAVATPPIHLLLPDDQDTVMDSDEQTKQTEGTVGVDRVKSTEDLTGPDAPDDTVPPDGMSKSELKAWNKERGKNEKAQKKLQAQEEKERKRKEAATAKAAKKTKGKVDVDPSSQEQNQSDKTEQQAQSIRDSASGDRSVDQIPGLAEDTAPDKLAVDADVGDADVPGPDLPGDKSTKKAREKAEKERQKLEAQEEKQRKKALAAEEKAAKNSKKNKGGEVDSEPESAPEVDTEPESEPEPMTN